MFGTGDWLRRIKGVLLGYLQSVRSVEFSRIHGDRPLPSVLQVFLSLARERGGYVGVLYMGTLHLLDAALGGQSDRALARGNAVLCDAFGLGNCELRPEPLQLCDHFGWLCVWAQGGRTYVFLMRSEVLSGGKN